MTSEAFVQQLAALAPSKEALLANRYDDEEADEWRGNFLAPKRSTSLDADTVGDPVLGLHAGWDPSRIEIGMVRFLERPQPVGDYLQVATDEVDPIVLRPRTGDYVELDSGALSRVMCGVAADGASLLEGLLIIAGFYAKCSVGELSAEDEPTAEPYKRRCVAALGGDEYEGFATSIFGF